MRSSTYETKEVGLGARVVQEFDEAVALVMEFPGAAALVREVPERFGLHWTLLRTFPLKLVYAVRADELVVVAVFHAARRPGYWSRRLKQLR